MLNIAFKYVDRFLLNLRVTVSKCGLGLNEKSEHDGQLGHIKRERKRKIVGYQNNTNIVP